MIGIASDHAGFEMKRSLIGFLEDSGYQVKDFGTFSQERMDYPDVAHPLADSVAKGEVEFGIGLCSSGNGISMTFNKHPEIRAALCWNEELASLARHHNDANILTLPAHFISNELAEKIVTIFLKEPFDGGRHLRRIEKIPCK